MKLLLDENVDEAFSDLIPGHDVRHVGSLGWLGLANGKLLEAAESAGFNAIITADGNFQHQQRIDSRSLALIVLDVHPRNMTNLLACVPPLLAALPEIEAGQVRTIHGPHPKRKSG